MTKVVAETRPLSHEEVGVIGVDGVDSDVQAPLSDGEARAAARPADGSAPVESITYASGFDRVTPPEQAEIPHLPENFTEWEGFKNANGPARDDFENVVLFPGYVFVAGGRYVDAQNISRIFDVEPDQIVPKGLYLVGVNYLAPPAQRRLIASGDARPVGAPKQPNPLRTPKSEA